MVSLVLRPQERDMSSDLVTAACKWSEELVRDGVRVTVPDWLIESQLADQFRDSAAVQAFAVFGYGNALRVSFTARVASITIEQTYELTVAEVVWEQSRRELVLAANKVMTHFQRWYHRWLVGSLAGLPSLVIPYVGDVIGGLIVDRLVDACVHQALRPSRAAAPARFEGSRLVINLASIMEAAAMPGLEQMLQTVRPVEWKINREGLEMGFRVANVTELMAEAAAALPNQAMQLAEAAFGLIGVAQPSRAGGEERQADARGK
jgi:hypothetical protein